MSLTAFRLADPVPALDAWGAPEDIGATTLDGPIACSGVFTLGGPTTPVFGGLYAATRGRYRVTYAFDEHATLLEGTLAITDETTGATTLYGPGDGWIVAAGTPVVWEIRSDRIVKSWLGVMPAAA